MRRIALGVVLVLAGTAAPASAQRTDRIPPSVGPAEFRSFHVNPSANLPDGLTEAQWNEAAKRVLERWGGTYLGTTAASPDDHEDGLNVIGFSTALTGFAVGQNAKSKSGLVGGSAGDQCESAPGARTTESVADGPVRFRLRLRADVVRRGRVRKRFKRVTRTLVRRQVLATPVDVRKCVRTMGGLESDPASIRQESDVQMNSRSSWFAGPALPGNGDLDLETVLLHELGHSVGLAHQPQDCDPSSPMRPVGSPGDYWRGLDEVRYGEPCSAPYPVTPDPPTGAEGPFQLGATLGGRVMHVNPAVPPGYDGARFVEVARSAIERWGGVYAGPTAAPPQSQDALNIVGFDSIVAEDYEVVDQTHQQFQILPPLTTCATTTGRPPIYRVKRVKKRIRVRVASRLRTFRVRRDRAVKATGPTVQVPTGKCTTRPPGVEDGKSTTELDIGIAHELQAYELGPGHPVLRTKVDMATLLAKALGQAAGAPFTDRCDRSSPVATLQPGDWWRSPADVQRVGCDQGTPGRTTAPTLAPDLSGRVRHLLIQQ